MIHPSLPACFPSLFGKVCEGLISRKPFLAQQRPEVPGWVGSLCTETGKRSVVGGQRAGLCGLEKQTRSRRSFTLGEGLQERLRPACLPWSFLLFSFSLAAKRAWARVLRPAVASPGNFLSVSQKNSSTRPYPGAWVPEAILSCQESLGHRDALKELSPRSQSLPPSPGLLLLPRSRVQKV